MLWSTLYGWSGFGCVHSTILIHFIYACVFSLCRLNPKHNRYRPGDAMGSVSDIWMPIPTARPVGLEPSQWHAYWWWQAACLIPPFGVGVLWAAVTPKSSTGNRWLRMSWSAFINHTGMLTSWEPLTNGIYPACSACCLLAGFIWKLIWSV